MADLNIEFKTNPLMSFYQFIGSAPKFKLDGFPKEMNSLLDCGFDFRNLTGSHFYALRIIEKAIDSGSIQDIDKLITVIQRSGVKKDLNRQKVQQSYAAYLTFWENNVGIIKTNQEEMQKAYTNPQIVNRAQQIHKFFNFDLPMTVSTYLHPFPVENKCISGFASQKDIVHSTFYTKRVENNENYLGQSTLLKRRITTPLHEATHALFFASSIYQKAFVNKLSSSDGIENLAKLQKYIDDYFKSQGKTGGINSANGVLHEAFASTLGSTLFHKDDPNFNPKTFEFYYGFPEANNLARIVYPITQDYIQQGKGLDDQFFQKVIQDPSFKKTFILPTLRPEFMSKKSSFCK